MRLKSTKLACLTDSFSLAQNILAAFYRKQKLQTKPKSLKIKLFLFNLLFQD